jgi:hypothetical protein
MGAKTIAGLFMMTILVGSGSSSALGQALPRPQGPAPMRELFLDLDSNGDRVISADEVPAKGRAAFQTLLEYGDLDHDGKLSADEFRGVLERANRNRPVASPEQRQRRFAQLDANGDGKLDDKELPGGPARLRRFDRDGDGFLSREEFVAMILPAPGQKPKPKVP